MPIAASLFDHPGFLLLLVFVALVRWLASKAKSENRPAQSPPPPPPASRPISRGGETQSEEERVRKFLEALGQPPGSTPPKVAPRRRAVQPTVFRSPLPPLTTAPPPVADAPALPPPLPVQVATLQRVSQSRPDFEVHDVTRQTSSEPPTGTQRAAARFPGRIKLGTPQDLRTAIVLREIFGPPRSLQAFDVTSGF
jgi:hypothetical protein